MVDRFLDRRDAGAKLAAALPDLAGEDVLVLGLARGGMPVAAEVARRLGADLDVRVVRKLGAPGQAELAIGAVTADGQSVLNEDLIAAIGVSADYLEAERERQIAEARQREERLRGARAPRSASGRRALLVDDGLATGASMRAAVRSVRAEGPAELIVAVPVGAGDSCVSVGREADRILCLSQPEPFHAVGLHYVDFAPTTDEEVGALLEVKN